MIGDAKRTLAHLVTTATGARARICCNTPETAKPIVTKAQARRQSAINWPRTLRLMTPPQLDRGLGPSSKPPET
jgi:hypothetical protein